jgi:SAM-dependent methyltransferase
MSTIAESGSENRVLAFCKRRREGFLDRHGDALDWYNLHFSAGTYSLGAVSRRFLAAYCEGDVLDAGAGRGGWRSTIEKRAWRYDSIDASVRGDHRPTWVGDIEDMNMVPDGHYDTVVCQQVLEHVRHPWRVLEEFHRVLKPGGTVVLSVPHLSRRHELPHDYFRYTQEGLTALFEDAGFEIVEMTTYGGILSFLHHQSSFLFPGVLQGIPGLGQAASIVNAPFSRILAALDGIVDRRALMPLGVMVAARKPDEPRGTAMPHNPRER